MNWYHCFVLEKCDNIGTVGVAKKQTSDINKKAKAYVDNQPGFKNWVICLY